MTLTLTTDYVAFNLSPGLFNPETVFRHCFKSQPRGRHLRGGLLPRFPPDGLPVVLGALGGLPPPPLPPPLLLPPELPLPPLFELPMLGSFY